MVQTMDADPLIADEAQPTQTLAAMVRADDRLKQEFPQIKLPLLILHGTADKAAKASGSQYFYDTAGSSDKTLKLYDGHFHDLLNDLGKEDVMADIKAWIASHLALIEDESLGTDRRIIRRLQQSPCTNSNLFVSSNDGDHR